MGLYAGRTAGFFNNRGGFLFSGVRGGLFSGKGLSSGSGVPATFDEAMEDDSGKVMMEDGSGYVRLEQP